MLLGSGLVVITARKSRARALALVLAFFTASGIWLAAEAPGVPSAIALGGGSNVGADCKGQNLAGPLKISNFRPLSVRSVSTIANLGPGRFSHKLFRGLGGKQNPLGC